MAGTSLRKPESNRYSYVETARVFYGLIGCPRATTDNIQRSSEPKRILLAEDNPINQKVASRLLQKMGHQVDIAANGRQALEAVAGKTYDLVLMDCQMPEMDGYAATAAIRQLTSCRGLPIVAMTAHAMVEDRQTVAK